MNLNHKFNKLFKGLGFIAAFMLCLVLAFASSDNKALADETTEENWVHYVGISNGRVNVRTGPGEKYDKITDASGNPIQLQAQEEVEIIGEKTSDSGKIWYNIRFTKDGVEYEGFSTSSYISKDEDRIITPSPTPSPTPTPSPSPTPTAVPTEAPTPTPELIQESTEPENSKDTVLFVMLVVIGVAILFLILLIVLNLIKGSKRRNGTAASRKVDKLKKLNLEGQSSGKKAAQIKKLDDLPPVEEEVRQDVYYKKTYDYSEDYTVDSSKNKSSKELEEKKQLRAAIEHLQEHDIVYHTIYGEGEVFDNSDVNLLEVRFGNDMRFLKKDQLVDRRELQIADEEEQSIAKRRRRRNK